MNHKCPACGIEAEPGVLRCGLCRASLPRRRHRHPARSSASRAPEPPIRPVPPLPPDWRNRTVMAYLEKLSGELAPRPAMPMPRWFLCAAWGMLGGTVATGMALLGLILGLSRSP